MGVRHSSANSPYRSHAAVDPENNDEQELPRLDHVTDVISSV